MRSWTAPLARKLRALSDLVRVPRRGTAERPTPRTPRLGLTELERRDLLSVGDVIAQNHPGYESDYPTGFGLPPGHYAAICIGLEDPPASGTVTIDWATADGTARAGSDYTASGGTVTLTAGTSPEYWQYVFVPLADDAVPEPTETFYVHLSNPTGGAVLWQTDFPVTVMDDDSGAITALAYQLVDPVCPCFDLVARAVAEAPPPRASGPSPVRYADGVATVVADDLTGALGVPWGLQRTWTNADGYAAHPDVRNGWGFTQTPFLLQQADGYDDTLIEVANGTTSRFFDTISGGYVSRAADGTTLAHDATDHLFVLTDGTGARVAFYDFSTTYAAGRRGRFAGYEDPSGNDVSVVSSNADGQPTEVQQSAVSGGVTTTESYLFAYSGGLASSVTLRRKVGAGSWQAVRSV